MTWDNNPYGHPDKFGLTVLADMNWYDEPYEFSITAAWKSNESGSLYWAHDSGCSCPSPFEEYDTLDDLATGTIHELFADLDANLATFESWGGNTYQVASSRVAQFKEEVLRKCR